jgi:hypothetical protein
MRTNYWRPLVRMNLSLLLVSGKTEQMLYGDTVLLCCGDKAQGYNKHKEETFL